MKNDNILDMNSKSRLTADITFLMLKGAGYAAVVVLAIWFFIAAFAAVGRALPDESRATPDPINRPAPMVEQVVEPVAVEPVTDEVEPVADEPVIDEVEPVAD